MPRSRRLPPNPNPNHRASGGRRPMPPQRPHTPRRLSLVILPLLARQQQPPQASLRNRQRLLQQVDPAALLQLLVTGKHPRQQPIQHLEPQFRRFSIRSVIHRKAATAPAIQLIPHLFHGKGGESSILTHHSILPWQPRTCLRSCVRAASARSPVSKLTSASCVQNCFRSRAPQHILCSPFRFRSHLAKSVVPIVKWVLVVHRTAKITSRRDHGQRLWHLACQRRMPTAPWRCCCWCEALLSVAAPISIALL